MILKGLVEEDFVNYKKPSMVLLMPHCNWKCGGEICHNLPFVKAPDIIVDENEIAVRYAMNPITEAIVFSGLEPFMDFKDVLRMITALRRVTDDTIVIYTGYNRSEVQDQIIHLQEVYSHIIVKFGRFVPGQESHFEELLGVTLASPNQYSEKIC